MSNKSCLFYSLFLSTFLDFVPFTWWLSSPVFSFSFNQYYERFGKRVMPLLYYLFAHNSLELFFTKIYWIRHKNIIPHCVLFLIQFIILSMLLHTLHSKKNKIKKQRRASKKDIFTANVNTHYLNYMDSVIEYTFFTY